MTEADASAGRDERALVERRIAGFRQDEEGDWIALLECGHSQHVRHDPPWQVREWVTTEEGRRGRIGAVLLCGECGRG